MKKERRETRIKGLVPIHTQTTHGPTGVRKNEIRLRTVLREIKIRIWEMPSFCNDNEFLRRRMKGI